LAIRVNRSLVILKICYDEAYSSYSPGTILFGKMLERVFNSGEVDEVNLLTDYAWNQNWQVEKRSYHNLILFPAKPFPLLAGYIPLKMRVGLSQVSSIRKVSHFCRASFKGGGLKKVFRSKENDPM
jgi:hypothetical protein